DSRRNLSVCPCNGLRDRHDSSADSELQRFGLGLPVHRLRSASTGKLHETRRNGKGGGARAPPPPRNRRIVRPALHIRNRISVIGYRPSATGQRSRYSISSRVKASSGSTKYSISRSSSSSSGDGGGGGGGSSAGIRTFR